MTTDEISRLPIDQLRIALRRKNIPYLPNEPRHSLVMALHESFLKECSACSRAINPYDLKKNPCKAKHCPLT